MKKVELLSPAGNFDALKMAVQNGCDAVYVGGKKFGARAFSNNFDNEELVEAINYCHLYGVKIYITINTIVYDSEVEEFLKYIEFIYKNGVDAVIIQDYGMIDLIRQKFPNLELHSSTQMNIHTVDELKKMKELGFKRVVLARETSIETIKQMKKEVDIELEVFIHGALCVSCSGQCLMSYMVGKRSGNRGECAGICRQKYSLYENDKEIKLDDKYLLSMKDLCLIDKLNELISLGIDSFKIEGRMKSKEYVGVVTKCYRNSIDFKAFENEKNDMFKMFNRGYTLGNIYNKKGKEIVNGFRPNHMGYNIGEVINYNKNRVKIKLNNELNQGDGIRFLIDDELGFIANKIYKNNLLVNKANKDEIIELECNRKIKNGVKVNKTLDIKLVEKIDKESKNKRKISLNGNFIVKNNKIIFTVTDKENSKTIKINDSVTKAKTKPTTEFEIREKLNKLGNSPYVFNELKIDIPDNIFISMSIINNLRRDMINEITNLRINKEIKEKSDYLFSSREYISENNYVFDIQNEKQLEYILNNTKYICYVEDYLMYKKYEDNNRVIYKSSRVEPLNVKIDKEYVTGEISKIKENTISDTSFNVVNSYAVNFLHNMGVKRVTLSYEIDLNDIEKLYKEYVKNYNVRPNLEVVVYGKPEVMISKYCLINTYLGNGLKTKCNLCKTNKYYLKDKYGNKYIIKKSNNCYMKILDYKNIDKINDISKMKSIGINTFRLILNDENDNEIKQIIDKIKNI